VSALHRRESNFQRSDFKEAAAKLKMNPINEAAAKKMNINKASALSRGRISYVVCVDARVDGRGFTFAETGSCENLRRNHFLLCKTCLFCHDW
jgi:hypothetical protein